MTISSIDSISQLTQNIVDLVQQSKHKIFQQVNSTMLETYYEIGRLIVENEQQGQIRAQYGKKILQELSNRLNQQFGKGFSVDNLGNMRKLYLTYSVGAISETVSRKLEDKNSQPTNATQKSETVSRIFPKRFSLSWSHYVFLMHIDNELERNFYEIEAINQNWSLRELKRQFNAALFERLALSKNKAELIQLSQQGQIIEKPEDIVKDPLILEFLGLPEQATYSETELEQQIINKLQLFLLELGKGYTFVGRQVRLTFDEKHFFVDLVFFNRILQCFVLIDLKIGEITHQDLGQMQMYVNYYDRKIKLDNENSTVGMVLCKKKNDTLVELTLPESNTQIFASKYQTVLPDKEDFARLLEK